MSTRGARGRGFWKGMESDSSNNPSAGGDEWSGNGNETSGGWKNDCGTSKSYGDTQHDESSAWNGGGDDTDAPRGGGYNRDGDDDGEGDGFRGRGRGRGRGGRGGGRGRGRDRGRDGDSGGYGDDSGDQNDDGVGESTGDGEEKRTVEKYIPPEPTEDEGEMFSHYNSGINFDKYDSIPVKVTGNNPPRGIESFQEAGLRTILMDNIKKSGYTKATPVQKRAIPIINNGRDLMACAQTGSGKTAAFLLPIIQNVLENNEAAPTGLPQHPIALIISPTRELTQQIFNEARKFAHGSIVKIALLYGGADSYHQGGKLLQGAHIVVATPGRLLDFVERNKVTFDCIKYLVLDEADRMLDMGFMPDVKRVVEHESMTPHEMRTTLMFSATFPPAVQESAKEFLRDYVFVAVGIVGGACKDVTQEVYEMDRSDKRAKLDEIIREQVAKRARTMIFVETKKLADFLACQLCQSKFPATSIHGDRQQREREEALRDFKSGKCPVIVATAVAARGLDIREVACVVNYDLPSTLDEYVHRIGRTGRLGNTGRAVSFYDNSKDGPLAKGLVKILEEAGQKVPDFLRAQADQHGGDYDGFGGMSHDTRGGSGETWGQNSGSAGAAAAAEEEW